MVLDRFDVTRMLSEGEIANIGCEDAALFGDNAVNIDRLTVGEIREETGKQFLEIPNFVQADAENLPFDDNAFDTAVLGELLEHVDSPDSVLREASRVAGVVVISVPNEYGWHPSYEPFTYSDHQRYYTEQSFKQQIRDADLKPIVFLKLEYQGWSFFIAKCVKREQ